jgi:alkanesulfonate monooxygenase SsuD/methylene tetrahydromethanopterin reductase-like flavin-dependent oxidoreductase (luciferase family)
VRFGSAPDHRERVGKRCCSISTDGPDGRPLHAAQVIRNLVEEAVLADEVGVDFIGVGEHHRADFAVSSPEIALAAVASRTKCISLGSAVSVLSSDGPIRVFQRVSTFGCGVERTRRSYPRARLLH